MSLFEADDAVLFFGADNTFLYQNMMLAARNLIYKKSAWAFCVGFDAVEVEEEELRLIPLALIN